MNLTNQPQNFNSNNYNSLPQQTNNNYSIMSKIALVLSVLGCTALIGCILAIVDITKKDGTNKKLSKIALGVCGFWLLFSIILSNVNKKTDTNISQSIEVTTETVEETTEILSETEQTTEEQMETIESFNKDTADYVLKEGELGEYGRVITLNANSDMPEDKYLYKLPSGTYVVTTNFEKMTGFNIVKDEITIEEGNDDYPECLDYVSSSGYLSANPDYNENANTQITITLNDDESISIPTTTPNGIELYFFKQAE